MLLLCNDFINIKLSYFFYLLGMVNDSISNFKQLIKILDAHPQSNGRRDINLVNKLPDLREYQSSRPQARPPPGCFNQIQSPFTC